MQSSIDQLRCQRLVPFQNLAYILLDHLYGIFNYCRTKVPWSGGGHQRQHQNSSSKRSRPWASTNSCAEPCYLCLVWVPTLLRRFKETA